MAQNAKEWFEQVCKEAGLSAEETTALTAAASNEKLTPKLNEIIKRGTDDYNAMLGRVRAADEKVNAYEKDWFPKAQAEYNRMLKSYNELVAQMETGAPAAFDASKYLTKDDWQKLSLEQNQRYAQVLKQTTRLASRHAAKFGEELDVDAIDKIATEQNLPIEAAYDKWVEPRLKEQAEKQRTEWEKKTREEIERDVRSRYKLPVDPTPTETAPVYSHVKPDQVPHDMDAELLAAWHGGK